MIQGPNAGPAMVLNILMRWPPLIVVAALAGVGAMTYDKVDADEYIESFKKAAVELGIVKATQVAEAAKKVEIIPAATAAVPPLVALTPVSVESTAVTPETIAELQRLRRIELESRKVYPVVVTTGTN